jgi:hypothetical protein
MKRWRILFALFAAWVIPGSADAWDQLDSYDVQWTTPSRDSSGSMPIGNGDIGLNVWVEADGDLLFYVSKSDAWSGEGRLLKLGRVRVSLEPNPFAAGLPFRQTLRLREGRIEIAAGPEGRQVTLQVWVEAQRPVVHVEADGQEPFVMQTKLEVWRRGCEKMGLAPSGNCENLGKSVVAKVPVPIFSQPRPEPRTLSGGELGSAYGMTSSPDPVVVEADTVLPAEGNRLVWFHRNTQSCYPVTLQVQALGALIDRFPDPLLHRTFGGCLHGEGLVAGDDTTLRSSQPAARQQVALVALTAQAATIPDWVDQLNDVVRSASTVELEQARTEHRSWWSDFWNRSWIFAETPAVPGTSGAITANELPLRIGADSEGQNRFQGRMARASVLGRALSEAEVADLAGVGRGQPLGDVPGLVASWRFERAADGVIPNSAGESFPAKIVGAVRAGEDAEESAFEFAGGYVQIEHDPQLTLTEGLTLEAWIAPAKLSGGGARIIDKSKAATANGYLLDTHPGNSLRSIVQAGTLLHEANLAPGQWVHVAATFDPQTDRQCLYVQGRLAAVRGEDSAEAETPLSPLTQGYILQRFINACGGRGAYPIKFNGSIFTVDAQEGDQRYDADYRRWGGCYWFQNTRLPYWSMLSAGDFDLLQPLFRMYADALPLGRERTRTYYGHDGVFFPETMYFWGTYNNDNYGWNRQGKPDGLTDNRYIRYYWDSGLELLAMMLDYVALTQDEAFVRETLLPLAHEILTFYQQHYPQRDAGGKIVFEPSQALETWHDATNPLPVVAGLRYVIERLLADVPPDQAGEARAAWERLAGLLPELPMQEEAGRRRILPAQRFAQLANSENPELYAVFPFRLFTLGQPDLEIGRATFEARRVKRTGGWTQDPIQAALLGLTDTAAAYTYKNFSTKHAGSRFPAFWGPNFDWIPDQDHGGVAMIALQRMLLQCDGDRILLLPAWPPQWNVDFRLHAPQQTTVHAIWRDGRLQQLDVQPERRRRDVIGPPACPGAEE